jgi:thiol-disulfide isomerase/thioredoxin
MTIAFVLLLSMSQNAPAPAQPSTPSACLASVRSAMDRARTALPAPTATNLDERRQLTQAITRDSVNAARACAAKFDPKTAGLADLPALLDLYTMAQQPELSKIAVERALTMKFESDADRATVLAQAIRIGLSEPIGPERNARLEGYVDQLDRMSDAVFDQKFNAHSSLGGYYRYDDIDAGIIKHSTWIIDAAKSFTPERRRTSGAVVANAYVNLAQAWAGQGMNDKAIALLEGALTSLAGVPNADRSIKPEIERLKLVGTPAASIEAPRWLNYDGKALDLKGKVTLLEFSAHWCVPCKESYPGVNRLREQYAAQGFQVVLATELYGFFSTERPLAPETEIERDRTYFAEHHLDVPIAIADQAKADAPNPNNTRYKLGGIPQIHLIDRQGRIRLVMVGYDDANEAKLEKLIQQLLAEK